MASRPWSRPVLAAAAVLAAALTVTGCVSMPSAGPVQTYPVTQGPNAQNQGFVRNQVGPPRPGWSPAEIVTGFLAASASFGDNGQAAREYLTPQAREEWDPAGSGALSAVVYRQGQGPSPARTVYSPVPTPTATATAKGSGTPNGKAAKRQQTATVTISGKVQAILQQTGRYSVATPTSLPETPSFELVMLGGQWRISRACPFQGDTGGCPLLLDASSFGRDYQLRNLYFFDPQTKYLVPDPVYVPLQATPADLMDGLVRDLITQPGGWLAGATKTAFPGGTTLIGDVTLDGVTAVVNLGGAIVHAPQPVMEQVSGQLLRTLSGTGQGGQAVQSIEVLRNGRAWIPSHSQDNPVQATSRYTPASGESGTFYFLGRGGEVFSQTGAHGKPAEVNKIGAQFKQIAVSPDSKYLAALTPDGDLYTGSLTGKLTKRTGTGYTSVSWDPNGDLWAVTPGGEVVVLLHGGQLVSVTGVDDVTALQVAPDGVRVAMITGGEVLEFGAISWHLESQQGQIAEINTSPFSVQSTVIDTVTWYGPDNVITFTRGSSPTVTEYPVNGGNSTAIPSVPNMQSITASSNQALIAGMSTGDIMADASLTGSWGSTGSTGSAPVYPG